MLVRVVPKVATIVTITPAISVAYKAVFESRYGAVISLQCEPGKQIFNHDVLCWIELREPPLPGGFVSLAILINCEIRVIRPFGLCEWLISDNEWRALEHVLRSAIVWRTGALVDVFRSSPTP